VVDLKDDGIGDLIWVVLNKGNFRGGFERGLDWNCCWERNRLFLRSLLLSEKDEVFIIDVLLD
jgi:hypothetical protein